MLLYATIFFLLFLKMKPQEILGFYSFIFLWTEWTALGLYWWLRGAVLGEESREKGAVLMNEGDK